jgi:hypothetical protein
VIVAPTHELAIQIQRQCTDLAQNAGWPIRTLLLIGGTAIDRQIDKLKKKPQVVVGSPGRIADLIAMVALATVFRRTVDRPWTSLGAVAADGRGRMEFVDTAVQGGNRYGYGLGVDAGDANQIVATSWVDVPHTAQFALRGARPNPSSRGLSVEFSLPDAVPARIELFDLAGRRLAQHDVGPLGAGTHTMRLDPRQGLASGVYHIRLTRQGRSLTDRAVVVQQ